MSKRSLPKRHLLTLGLLAFVACGPKNSDLLQENKTFSAMMLSRMAQLPAIIDEMPIYAESRCKPPGKLTYAPKTDAGDTDYVMYEELKRIGKGENADAEKGQIDLSSDGLLPYFLVWTDSASKYYLGRPGQSGERATPLVRDTFRRVKNLKHLVVIKPRPIEREAGEVSLDTILVDLKALKPLCGFTVTARADPKLGIEHYKVIERNRRTGAERELRRGSRDNFHSALWQDARKQTFAEINKQLSLDTPN